MGCNVYVVSTYGCLQSLKTVCSRCFSLCHCLLWDFELWSVTARTLVPRTVTKLLIFPVPGLAWLREGIDTNCWHQRGSMSECINVNPSI